MSVLALWLAAAILVEAVTELLHQGVIFERLREFLHRLSDFTSKLVGCGYCLSVWVAAPIAWMLPFPISEHPVVNGVLATFILHRLSNITHEGVMRWFSRGPLITVHQIQQVQFGGNDDQTGPNP